MKGTFLLLLLAGCAGEIGSDPEGYDGAIAEPTAQPEEGDAESPAAASDRSVVINEVAASGEPEDWFEVTNLGKEPVSLAGLRFTDDLMGNPGGRAFGEVMLAPGAYHQQFVTKDDAGFKLGKEETLSLVTKEGALLDEVSWVAGDSPKGGSYARAPDGTGDFVTATPATPGEANAL